MERALKPKQVAEILNVHIDRVYELANRGEIPAFRLGREWRTSPSQLEKFMAGEWKPAAPKRRRGRQLTIYPQVFDSETNPKLQ